MQGIAMPSLSDSAAIRHENPNETQLVSERLGNGRNVTSAHDGKASERIRATPEDWAYIHTAASLLAEAAGYGSGLRAAILHSGGGDDYSGEAAEGEGEGSLTVARGSSSPLQENVDGYELRRGKKWNALSTQAVSATASDAATFAALSFAELSETEEMLLQAYVQDVRELPAPVAKAIAGKLPPLAVSHAWARLMDRPAQVDNVASMNSIAIGRFRRGVRDAEAFLIGQLVNASRKVLQSAGYSEAQPLEMESPLSTALQTTKKQRRSSCAHWTAIRDEVMPGACVEHGPDSAQAADARDLIERPAPKGPQRWKTKPSTKCVFDRPSAPQAAVIDKERRPRATWRPLAMVGEFHNERYGFTHRRLMSRECPSTWETCKTLTALFSDAKS